MAIELRLRDELPLASCPHCGIAKPRLYSASNFNTKSVKGVTRFWNTYACSTCGMVTTAFSMNSGQSEVKGYFPENEQVNSHVPEPANRTLGQVKQSFHVPEGAIMLAAKAVDEMLKLKGLKEGTLYARIKKAADDRLITNEMEKWAHRVRLDANDQRHADEDARIPTEGDAKRCSKFADALAEYLFVLPAMVDEGIKEAEDKS